MRRPIISIFLFLAAVAVAVSAAGHFLSMPSKGPAGSPPKDLNARPVTFQSESGNRISGWFIKGREDRGGILLMHALRSSRLQMVKRAGFLNRYGYSVLLFDFQSHGESQGDRITFGYLEALDAEAGFSFLEGQLADKRIGVIGVSLGGAAALLGKVAGKADALVLESVYPTFQEAVRNRLTMRLGRMGAYLEPLLTMQMAPVFGFGPDALRPIDRIADARGAVFVICGSLDRRTTPEESKRLYDRAPWPKRFWEIEGARHMDFSKFVPEAYEEQILAFFGEHL